MKKREYQYILFDLDGTLTDSREGIVKCVKEALSHFGIEQTEQELEKFIGPPLVQSFPEFYGFDEEKTMEAIGIFRKRYNTVGVYENEIYPGIAGLLKECKKEGKIIAVASSKPENMVHKVLSHFEIEKYFDVIVGSLGEDQRNSKIEVMQETLRQLFFKQVKQEDIASIDFRKIPTEKIVMIGDRHFDIEGANWFGMDSIGVTYGYALEGELKKAGATYLAKDMHELRKILLNRWQSDADIERKSFSKSLEMVAPLALYWIISGVATLFVAAFLGILKQSATKQVVEWIVSHSKELSVFANAVGTIATLPVSIWYYRKYKIPDVSQIVTRRNNKHLKQLLWAIFGASFGLAMTLNIMMGYIPGLYTASYEEVGSIQYSVPLLVGVFVFGILTPIGEELMFRGVIYNSLKRYFPPMISMWVCAFIFGLYHGNLTQFVYATAMGFFMVWVYERIGKLQAPIFIHCGANCFIYVISKNAEISAKVSQPIGLFFFFACAVISIGWIVRKTKSA